MAAALDLRCRVMAVLNVTPDSFSDGGRWVDPAAAVAHGRELISQGADYLDIGGESTRPGAGRVSVDEELRRVIPVVQGLAGAGVPLSIDTTRAEVARAAIANGAAVINDVSGGLADPQMLALAAELTAPIILMHWRGPAASMEQLAHYGDVVAEVTEELRQRVLAARAAGVATDQIILDPGLGFAKTAEHNWRLLAGVPQLLELGYPLLIGASRKRFLRELVPAEAADSARVDELSALVTTQVARAGVWGVRVHEVPRQVTAIQVAAALGAS